MASLEMFLHRVMAMLSAWLEPLVDALYGVNAAVQQKLQTFGIPFEQQRWIVIGLWTLIVFMVVRTLGGWLRLVFLLCLAVVLAKMFGYLTVV